MKSSVKQAIREKYDFSKELSDAVELIFDRIEKSDAKRDLMFTRYSLQEIVKPVVCKDRLLSFFLSSLTSEPRLLERIYFYDNKDYGFRELDPELVSESDRSGVFFNPITGEVDQDYKKHVKIYYKLSEEFFNEL